MTGTVLAAGAGSAVLAFLGLFALSFFFSGTETAFFSLQEIDRRRIHEGETPTDRRIDHLLQRRTALITTILIGNETVNVAISATAAGMLALMVPEAPWLSIVVVTPALVLFSEITPKVLAFRFNRRWVQIAVWPLTFLYWVLLPIRLIVTGIVSGLARLFGVTQLPKDVGIREDEFLVLVERGLEQGVVGEDEREIIEAVFELDDLPISRLMTPRPDMFSLPIDIGWDELLAACKQARYSRVPIWEDTSDNIVGVLLLKDLLRHRRRPLRGPDEVRRLLLSPVYVPATKPANEMMREMIRRRIHMAFVVDEHGTIMGLVSLDDLIVELVGELGDDTSEEQDLLVRHEDGTLIVRASIDLEDFLDDTGIDLPEGDYHTLGGFVFHVLGRIPRVGDMIEESDHRFYVQAVDGRRIDRLRVTPLVDATQAEASP